MTESERLERIEVEKDAEMGNAKAQAYLGILYLVDEDFVTAAKWFEKAAEQGEVEAKTKLGQLYLAGQGVPKNEAKAADLFGKAAEQGEARAQFYLGSISEEKGDNAKAAEWYEKAAEQGDRDAQFELGMLYINGTGIPKDHDNAIKWIKKAAEQGQDDAKKFMNLAEEDTREQKRKQAEYEETSSIMLIAALQEHSKGNNVKSTELFKQVEEYGAARELYELGCIYLEGKVFPRNPDKAKALINKAASKGHFEAKNWVKKEAADNEAAEKKAREEKEAAEKKAREEKEAEEKFNEVLNSKDADAQYTLGYAFRDGKGVPKNISRGVTLIFKAAENGHKEAIDYVNSIKREERLSKIGVLLQLGVVAGIFIYILKLGNLYEQLSTIMQVILPVGLSSIAIGLITFLFRRDRGSIFGRSLIVLLVIAMSITITIIEKQGFGGFLIFLIIFSLTAIPGFLMTRSER